MIQDGSSRDPSGIMTPRAFAIDRAEKRRDPFFTYTVSELGSRQQEWEASRERLRVAIAAACSELEAAAKQ